MDPIALIGPDDAQRKVLKTSLSKTGFRVTALTLPELAKEGFPGGRCTVVVLNLAGQNGVGEDIFRKIRKDPKLQASPLLVLLEAHQSQILQAGGIDDFLTVPYTVELLETRLKFLLRRLQTGTPDERLVIGPLMMDFAKYEVTLHQETLDLTYKEFELLKFLATHPDRVYNREQLLNQVWGYDYLGGTRTVDVHVRRLRAKLGPKMSSLVETIRNVGYKFQPSL